MQTDHRSDSYRGKAPISHDSYLQAAEGFLFTVGDDIGQLDLRLDDSLKIAEVHVLVSIARSLSRLAPPPPDPAAPATTARPPQWAAGTGAVAATGQSPGDGGRTGTCRPARGVRPG